MKFTNKTLAPFVLLLLALVLIIVQWLSTGVNGDTDSVTHFQIARYAFTYPAFFLNHWGKPLFTILSAPLAQFGYTGAIAFNLICGLLSAWFAYLICKRLEYRHAWAALVFTIFTPGYLLIMYSSLTEILFSLVLITSIYLFSSKRFIWSAILISLIPFARTEGVMYIALFIPALLWMKQYKALPFLLSGFAVFSIAGWPVYHDLLWFFTKMPYTVSSSALYGKGSFWYYFGMMDRLINYPLLILGITGLVGILLRLRSEIKNLRDIKTATLYILVIPAFFGFILAQSYLWWKGLGVLASDRFMACVLPLSAIMALAGFDRIMEKAKSSKVLYYVLGVFIIAIVAYKPFSDKRLPMKTGINFVVMEQLADWLKTTPYSGRMAYYSDPMFPFYMDINPFDTQRCFKIYSYEHTDPASILKPGELLIWDAQFAGFEGHLPFDSLMKNNKLRLLNVFTPVESFTIIGGAKYKLAVFMKADRDTTRSVYKQFYFNGYESSLTDKQRKQVSTEYVSGGKQSIMMTPDYVYGPTAEGSLKSLPGFSSISLRASVRILVPTAADKGQVLLVMSIEDQDHKVYKYGVAKDSETSYKPGEWFDLVLTDIVNHGTPADGTYKIYVWYTGKNKIYIDDLKLEYLPVGYE